MKKGFNTGLIAFAVLTYLTLIGLPTRLAGAAQPVLALLLALFVYAVLRRQATEMGRTTQLPHPSLPQIGEGTVTTPPPIWGRLGGGEQLPHPNEKSRAALL